VGSILVENKMQDISGPTLKSTQEEINKVLGMTYEVFKNSCCVEQGDSSSFSNLSPVDAAKLLTEILQLSRYKKYKDKATEMCIDYKSKSDKLEAANLYLSSRAVLSGSAEEIRKDKDKKLTSLKRNLKALENKYGKSEGQYNKVYTKWQNNSATLKEFNGKLTMIDASLEKLSKQADLVEKINGSCPLCNNALNADQHQVVRGRVLNEYQDLLSKKSSIELNMQHRQAQVKECVANLQRFNLKSQREEIKKLYVAVAREQADINALSNRNKEFENDKTKLHENLIVLTKFRKEETDYSELSTAFGSKGIPLLIIDNVLRELEILVNNNIKSLSDLPIVVELKTQRESVSGDLIDTFQILINNGRETRHYFNYSGGEKMIIDLSLRLGLSELLARRNNFKVDTLIIDEGLGSLDENNQINLIKTLNRLTNRFKTIIVITHTQAKDYFENYIVMSRPDKISELDFKGSLWYTHDRAGKT